MARLGDLFPGRKLQHEGNEDAIGRNVDPGGPLDLDGGVVFLAPPANNDSAAEPNEEDTPEGES